MKNDKFQLHDICNILGKSKIEVEYELIKNNIIPFTKRVEYADRFYIKSFYTKQQVEQIKHVFSEEVFTIYESKLNYLDCV